MSRKTLLPEKFWLRIKSEFRLSYFLCLCFIMFFLALTAMAQGQITYYNSYDAAGGEAVDLKRTSDGGYVLAGKEGFPVVLKTDSLGQTEWAKSLYYTSNQNIYDIEEVSNGGYLVLMDVHFQGKDNIVVVRLDVLGNLLWSKQYGSNQGSNRAYDLCVMGDGGFAYSGGGCSGNNFVFRCDASGNMIWAKNILVPGTSGGTAYRLMSNANGIMVCGMTGNLSTQDQEVYLYSMDMNGSMQWFKLYNTGYSWTQPNTFVELASGGWAISGYAYNANPADTEVFLLKTDNNGEAVWLKVYQQK